MEFKKYQHIERLGTAETEGIENGTCFVFPKIDGTNSQLWVSQEGDFWKLNAGSRNRHLSLDNDNAGFLNWCIQQPQAERFAKLFRSNRSLRLYGEWLVPHTLRTYTKSAWNHFYVFDVMEDDRYLSYYEYQPLMEQYGIEYIPPLCVIKNPTQERLFDQLEKNGYLIEDGSGVGEGIIIKNYEYTNKYGRQTWAKIVRNEFKAKHSKVQPTVIKEAKQIEEEIVDKFVTLSLVEKEYSKIVLENDGWSSKFIPKLIGVVFYCLVKEECWNFVKEFKNPTVDFKRLSYFSTVKIKELMPNLF